MQRAIEGVRVVSQAVGHPWVGEDGWATEVWETTSHSESESVARQASDAGWCIWQVGNSGKPGIVVYRKLGIDEAITREALDASGLDIRVDLPSKAGESRARVHWPDGSVELVSSMSQVHAIAHACKITPRKE